MDNGKSITTSTITFGRDCDDEEKEPSVSKKQPLKNFFEKAFDI